MCKKLQQTGKKLKVYLFSYYKCINFPCCQHNFHSNLGKDKSAERDGSLNLYFLFRVYAAVKSQTDVGIGFCIETKGKLQQRIICCY